MLLAVQEPLVVVVAVAAVDSSQLLGPLLTAALAVATRLQGS